MQAVEQVLAKLVFDVAAGVEAEEAATDAGEEREDRQEQHPQRRSHGGRRTWVALAEDGIDGLLRQPVDAIHAQLKHRQHQRASQVGGQILANQRA